MKDSKNSVIWLNNLSLSTLWKILCLNISRLSIDVCFMEKTYLGWILFQCLRFIRILKIRAVKIEYSMGDMRSETGEALLYESYRLTSETTIAIVDRFRRSSVYHGLDSFLTNNKLDLYFEKRIYDEIFPTLRLLCIIRWQIRNEKRQYRHTIICPENGPFSELQYAWPDKTISLEVCTPFLDYRRVHSFIKKLYNFSQDFLVNILPKRLRVTSAEGSCIAIHYAEGIDLKRRSDIFWYPDSHIDPERVLIYFDRSYNNPITKRHIRQIESMGMRWVSLCWRRDIPCSIGSVWRAPLKRSSFLTAFNKTMVCKNKDLEGTGKWFLREGIKLLKDVEYWQTFYQMFNIKVHHDAVESSAYNIAQRIALDFVGGIRVSKQRSELFIPVSDMIGYYPDHIFFSWNGRSPKYLQSDRNRNDYCIVSGFPYDAVFSRNRNDSDCLRERIYNEGGRFFVALYDNMFCPEAYYSKAMMLSFYRNFLEWILEDVEVGLIIKSKKPQVINALPEIHELLVSAKATGRCVLLDDVYGRPASDAAHGVDIAVGVGVSSAVTEAVIAGCRGVHCDLTGLHSHLFYKWGYEKVIFDNINILMKAIRRFKEKPESEPFFGDFSLMLDQLDPFRDGRAGERVGTYIRWFLEAIDAGMGCNTSIQRANQRYAKAWGDDKVISMGHVSNAISLLEDNVKLCGEKF
mgnify:CR=1 FL=1